MPFQQDKQKIQLTFVDEVANEHGNYLRLSLLEHWYRIDILPFFMSYATGIFMSYFMSYATGIFMSYATGIYNR